MDNQRFYKAWSIHRNGRKEEVNSKGKIDWNKTIKMNYL